MYNVVYTIDKELTYTAITKLDGSHPYYRGAHNTSFNISPFFSQISFFFSSFHSQLSSLHIYSVLHIAKCIAKNLKQFKKTILPLSLYICSIFFFGSINEGNTQKLATMKSFSLYICSIYYL